MVWKEALTVMQVKGDGRVDQTLVLVIEGRGVNWLDFRIFFSLVVPIIRCPQQRAEWWARYGRWCVFESHSATGQYSLSGSWILIREASGLSVFHKPQLPNGPTPASYSQTGKPQKCCQGSEQWRIQEVSSYVPEIHKGPLL
jgi:hypothetical protein